MKYDVYFYYFKPSWKMNQPAEVQILIRTLCEDDTGLMTRYMEIP